jgi:membrane-bound lytic murein transglycosylase
MHDLMAKMVSIGNVCLVLFLLIVACSHKPKPSAMETAGTAFDDLRAAVRSDIKDPDKAAQGASLVDQLEQLVIEANKDRKAHNDKMRTLNASYDATEEEFQTAFREFNARQKDRQDRVLEINQRAKDLTTEKEWKALAKVHEEMLKKALEATLEMQWQP